MSTHGANCALEFPWKPHKKAKLLRNIEYLINWNILQLYQVKAKCTVFKSATLNEAAVYGVKTIIVCALDIIKESYYPQCGIHFA